MASCIKTGAHLFLAEYGAFAYGDLHQVSEEVYVVRTTGPRSFSAINDLKIIHGIVHETYEWWNENEPGFGTLVVSRMEYLGYEGVEFIPASGKPSAA